MRILFTRFPLESRYGGAEVQTLSLMEGLRERGHEVLFLGSCPVLLREAQNSKFKFRNFIIGPPPVTKWGSVSFLWRKRMMMQKLTAALDSKEFQNIDVIYMLSLTEKLLLTEEAHRRGIQIFWIEHDRVGRWLTKNPWLKTLLRLSTFATTVCVSKLSRSMYLQLGFPAARVVAIQNGIDMARLSASKKRVEQRGPSPLQPSALHIGTISRLSTEKGIDLLIRAVGPVKEYSLTIIGTGSEEQRLRSMIKPFPNITILPHVEHLGDFYRSIDIFVLPSREHDPFGLVAAEAMLCGAPTIVTDACGIAGYIRDTEEALIVPADSVAALRHAIALLRHENVRLSMAERGKRAATKTFSIQAMSDAYEALLQTSSR